MKPNPPALLSVVQAEPLSLVHELPEVNLEKRSSVRFKLWQLQDCWHCVIIGTCLNLKEVRQQALKAGISTDNCSDYYLHRLAVENAANRNKRITLRLQKLLEKKYERDIRQFKAASGKEALLELWNTQRDLGRIAGALWALVTHPDSDNQLLHAVFGEVHMLSHLAGATVRVNLNLITTQKREIATLQTKLKNSLKHRVNTEHSMEARLKDLNERLQNSQQELLQARAVLDGVIERKAEPLIDDESNRLSIQQSIIDNLRKEVVDYRSQVKNSFLESRQLEKENLYLNRSLAELLDNSAVAEETELQSLCGRCVLFLGGNAKQCKHFQAMVEVKQGEFLHHDGGIEDSFQQIPELVHRSDAVLCPTDNISHGAMKKARRICKNQDKPMIFMKRASLAAFAESLEKLHSYTSDAV